MVCVSVSVSVCAMHIHLCVCVEMFEPFVNYYSMYSILSKQQLVVVNMLVVAKRCSLDCIRFDWIEWNGIELDWIGSVQIVSPLIHRIC